jgi:hypothetical protein
MKSGSVGWQSGERRSKTKGSRLKLLVQGRQSVLPMHSAEHGKGLIEVIKKQLGLKDKERLCADTR